MITATQKEPSNFKTVFKQTILSTFSQTSTWVSFSVVTCIMFLLMVLLPAVLPSDTGQLLILGMLYPISLMIIIQGVIATTNGLELHEMTFVLSRPVSRRVYIFAKICSSLVTCSLTLFVGIFCTLINISIFLLRDHVNVIAKQNVSWAVVFIPPILAYIFTITGSVFFRTFIKKDAVITVSMVIICLLTYQLYNIIFQAINPHTLPNPNIAYLIIPSVVFAFFSIAFLYFGYFIFQRMCVKV